MDEFGQFYLASGIGWAILCIVCIYRIGFTAQAARRIGGLSLIMFVGVAIERWLLIEAQSNDNLLALSEIFPFPCAIMMLGIAIGLSAARIARLAFFALLSIISIYQFDTIDILLLSMALAVDIELHEEAWKRGFIGALAGIAALWGTIYFLDEVLELTNASIVFAAAIFCFVHGLCFVASAPTAINEPT
ncbi:MAG: hypothetical protein RJP95_00740 [Pirellulales bacterium]